MSASTTPRLIDQDHNERKKPMRVLSLGLSRTGTNSMREALITLGYHPFHMRENILVNPRYLFPRWIEAMRGKYWGGIEPYSPQDLDKLLYSYDAVSDHPAVRFVDELLEAFPDAKVILTVRDPDTWLRSMRSTVWKLDSWRTAWLVDLVDYRLGQLSRLENLTWYGWIKEGRGFRLDSPEFSALARQAYIDHYDYVRKLVPKERLLEHRPQDGWKPLCDFLGHEVPIGQEYPRTNDAAEFDGAFNFCWWVDMAKAASIVVVTASIAVGTSWWLRQRR